MPEEILADTIDLVTKGSKVISKEKLKGKQRSSMTVSVVSGETDSDSVFVDEEVILFDKLGNQNVY